MKIDFNSDLGEGSGNDEAIMPYITSANIACGYHAGDEDMMKRTIDLALENSVSIGAHPGYADKENFGRRQMNLSREEIIQLVYDQVLLMKELTEERGGKLRHVKAHGALYNQASVSVELSKAIAEAVFKVDPKLIFVGLANSVMIDAAKDVGLKTASEVFADRAYTNDGKLVSRNEEGAVIHDEKLCRKRVLKMVQNGLIDTINGKEIAIQADTVCLHGDNPEAIALARNIHDYLIDMGIKIIPMVEL